MNIKSNKLYKVYMACILDHMDADTCTHRYVHIGQRIISGQAAVPVFYIIITWVSGVFVCFVFCF